MMADQIPCTTKELEDLRERAAQAACRYCSNGSALSSNGTHSIWGAPGNPPEIVWCEGRAIRNIPLVQHF